MEAVLALICMVFGYLVGREVWKGKWEEEKLKTKNFVRIIVELEKKLRKTDGK